MWIADYNKEASKASKLLRQHKRETLGPTWDFFLEDVPSIIGVV